MPAYANFSSVHRPVLLEHGRNSRERDLHVACSEPQPIVLGLILCGDPGVRTLRFDLR